MPVLKGIVLGLEIVPLGVMFLWCPIRANTKNTSTNVLHATVNHRSHTLEPPAQPTQHLSRLVKTIVSDLLRLARALRCIGPGLVGYAEGIE